MKKILNSQLYMGLKKGEVILFKPKYLGKRFSDERFCLCRVKNKKKSAFYFNHPFPMFQGKEVEFKAMLGYLIPRWTPYKLNKEELEYYEKLLMLEELKGKNG